MTDVWCVRADFGTYTEQFVSGDYVAIGWMPDVDLSPVESRDELYPLYKQAHPDDTSNLVVGQQVGQVARFLLEIQAGDYVITPAADTEWLHYGKVAADPSYVYAVGVSRPVGPQTRAGTRMSAITKSMFEQSVLIWLYSFGWATAYGLDVSSDAPGTSTRNPITLSVCPI